MWRTCARRVSGKRSKIYSCKHVSGMWHGVQACDQRAQNMRAPASVGITPTTASMIPRYRAQSGWGLSEGPGDGAQELTDGWL